MDVVALAQNGMVNAVATLAPPARHILKLYRYVQWCAALMATKAQRYWRALEVKAELNEHNNLNLRFFRMGKIPILIRTQTSRRFEASLLLCLLWNSC